MDMSGIIGAIIFWTIISSFIYLTSMYIEDAGECALTYYGFVTKYLWEYSKMNIIGCMIIAVLLYVIFPILVIRSIVMFIYWLLHFGRKRY